MAFVPADRVRETSTTPGTGTLTLLGATAVACQTFSTGVGNGNTAPYTIAHQTLNEWEVGVGTVAAGTLARTTVLASSNSNALVNFSAGTKDVWCSWPANRAQASGLGELFGLTLSTAGSSTTFSIAVGSAIDSTNMAVMQLAASLSKTTAAWAVGSGNGGLDTGVIANSTWYHAHLIKRVDTGVVDAVASLSVSAPTLPANYSFSRRLGSLLTNGSGQWTKFIQDGDEFTWDAPTLDVNTPSPGNAAVTSPLTVPAGVRVAAKVTATIIDTASVDLAYLSDLSISDQAPSGTASPGATVRSQVAGASGIADATILTNTSRQIRYRVQTGGANCTMRILTRGWIDRRGRDA